MGRQVILARRPQRIVSLVPSDTDSLFALGLGERVVGRTRYCVEPAGEVDDVPVVGGTKDVDVGAVMKLEPELVLANQEESSRAALEELAQLGATVFVAFPRRFADGLGHLARLARLCGVESSPRAAELIRRGYALLREPAPRLGVRVFVPIWADPLMTFNGDTYASDLLALAGAENVFADRQREYPLAADLGRRSPIAADQLAHRDRRYPRITEDEVIRRQPDLVLLPDEPHPFSEADAERFRRLDIPAAADGVCTVDGKDLFWYGARGVDALPRLRKLIASHVASAQP